MRAEETGNPRILLVGMWAGLVPVENNVVLCQKAKHRTAVHSSTPGYVPRRTKNRDSNPRTQRLIAAFPTTAKAWTQPRRPQPMKGQAPEVSAAQHHSFGLARGRSSHTRHSPAVRRGRHAEPKEPDADATGRSDDSVYTTRPQWRRLWRQKTGGGGVAGGRERAGREE